MKVLLDQDVPRRAAALLRDAGVDALHASEVGLSTVSDTRIVGWCLETGALAVTLDADLHEIVALSGNSAPSVIRIRVQGLDGPAVARLVRIVLSAHDDRLAAGALITVGPGRTRIRHLPIRREPA